MGAFLAGYAAGVDAPLSNCWRDLATTYPDAPVLLSRREDAEVWYRSMAATVLSRTRELLAKDDGDPMVPHFGVIFREVFTDIDDRDQCIAGYERWLASVRAVVDPARLIEWQPGDGWHQSATPWACPSRTGRFPMRTALLTMHCARRCAPARTRHVSRQAVLTYKVRPSRASGPGNDVPGICDTVHLR